MTKERESFLSAIVSAMEDCKVSNVLVIYTMNDNLYMNDILYNSLLSPDPESDMAKKLAVLSDRIDDYLRHNAEYFKKSTKID